MQAGVSVTDVASLREAAVSHVLAQVRRLVGSDAEPPRHVLERVGQLLAGLAAQDGLFPDAHFPAPSGAEDETLYLLGEGEDGTQALYVWRPAPGFRTAVHDHSTWAVVAGIEGEEPQLLWRRSGDANSPLITQGEVRVGPGQHIAFGPHDIHSVAIDGPRAIKHLHLYGRTLLDLPDRRDYDAAGGAGREVPGKPLVRLPEVTG